MRPTNSSTISYQPGDPPSDPALFPRFWREEQIKLAAAIAALADGFLPVAFAPPDKPRDGMLRNADGEQWDPGSGAGLYRFGGGTWHYLG